MNLSERFIELLLQAEVLRFGSFQTKSGRTSPYFFNAGNFNTGSLLNAIGAIYAQTLQQAFGSQIKYIYGPAYKGIPLSVATAMQYQMANPRSDLCVTFNRKEAKAHGEGGQLIGWPYRGGERVVLVEDVLTAGTSVRESLVLLKQYQVEPIGLVVGVDRQEKGSGNRLASHELQEAYGLKVVPIVTVEAIIKHLHNRKCLGRIWIDDEMFQKITQYRQAHT